MVADDKYDGIDVGEEPSQPYPAIICGRNILHYIPKEEK
jgi:hypothetical protein